MRIAARMVGSMALLIGGALGGCDRASEGGSADIVSEPVATATPIAAQDRSTVPAKAVEDVPKIEAERPIDKSPVLIQFEPPMIDFGFVPPNKNMSGTIVIRNMGNQPARIQSVKTTCKCTTLNDLDGTVIPANGTVDMNVVLEGRTVTGRRGAQIRVIIDGAPQPYQLDLSAEVTLGVRVNPSVLNMAPRKRGDPVTTTGFITLESVDGMPFNVLATNGLEPVYVDFDPDLDEPRSKYLVAWDLSDAEASAELPRWWVIETDHPDGRLLDAWVRHPRTIRRPPRGRVWSVPDLRVMAGQLAMSEPGFVDIRIKDISGDRINTVRSLSGAVDLELVGFEREGNDAICKVKVTPRSTGLLVAEIELISNASTHRMDIVGKIVP